LIDNTESGLRNPYGFLTLNRGPRTSLEAESRADLYLSHVSSSEKYKVKKETSGYATWFTAGGAIRIAHYDVIDDVITRKL